jgi:hypothetical protein
MEVCLSAKYFSDGTFTAASILVKGVRLRQTPTRITITVKPKNRRADGRQQRP